MIDLVPLPSISDGFSLDTKADNVFNSENSTIIDSETLSDEEERMEPKSTLKTSLYHVSNDHVHGQGYRWREHFDPSLLDRFSTYLYAFTWEDPRVDLQFLELTPKDRMLVITSGGCNVLEYAIKVGPQRFSKFNKNPCCRFKSVSKPSAGIKTCRFDLSLL